MQILRREMACLLRMGRVIRNAFILIDPKKPLPLHGSGRYGL
jgi:hypothetical protein